MQDCPDAFGDDVVAIIPQEFAGKVLFDDPVPGGDDELPDNATTPQDIGIFLKARAKKEWEARGRIKGLDADFASWAFNLASASPGRVNGTLPIHPAPWFVQFSGQVRQLSG